MEVPANTFMNALRRHQLNHPPPTEKVLGERRVDCGCEERLCRPVLLEPGFQAWSVHACCGCGVVTCSELRGDDGRFTGEACSVHFAIGLQPEVMAWLASWARLGPHERDVLWPMPAAWVRRGHRYLPAGWTGFSVEDLERREAALHEEQADLGVRQRLLLTGVPTEPPPAALPPQLAGFAVVWQAMQLTPEGDAEALLEQAQASGPGSDIAAELLAGMPDAPQRLEELLRSGRPAPLQAALAMLRAAPRPECVPLILEVLKEVPLTPLQDVPDRITHWACFKLLLLMLAELRPRENEVPAALRALMRKVARHDSSLVDRLRIVTALLESTGPSEA